MAFITVCIFVRLASWLRVTKQWLSVNGIFYLYQFTIWAHKGHVLAFEYVCLYVFMYICVFVVNMKVKCPKSVGKYKRRVDHACMYLCMCICACAHAWIHASIFVSFFLVCVCLSACTYVCMHVFTAWIFIFNICFYSWKSKS
jgi:hypothetical protein